MHLRTAALRQLEGRKTPHLSTCALAHYHQFRWPTSLFPPASSCHGQTTVPSPIATRFTRRVPLPSNDSPLSKRSEFTTPYLWYSWRSDVVHRTGRAARRHGGDGLAKAMQLERLPSWTKACRTGGTRAAAPSTPRTRFRRRDAASGLLIRPLDGNIRDTADAVRTPRGSPATLLSARIACVCHSNMMSVASDQTALSGCSTVATLPASRTRCRRRTAGERQYFHPLLRFALPTPLTTAFYYNDAPSCSLRHLPLYYPLHWRH